MVSLAERRRAVEYLRSEYAVSERHACRALQLHRSTCRYQPRRESIDQAHRQVVRLSGRYPCWGYRKIYELAKPDVTVSRERVRLIRRREGLQVVTRRRKRRVLGKTTQWVHRALYPNHVWSYDFVFDQTDDARTLKFLTIVDEFTRRGFDIHCSRSITAGDVVRVLARLFARYGSPEFIRSDNGTELISSTVRQWLASKRVHTHYIDPGCPWQNPFNESFNSIFRTTCLDRWLFVSLSEARAVVKQWLEEYNTVRPHGSLNGMPPIAYIEQWTNNQIIQPEILTL